MSCLCGGNFRSILNLDGGYQVGDGSDGQVVGQDTETAGIGGVRDTDLHALRVEISVAADLVAESIAVVGGGLSGVSVAETSLAQLILCVIAGGSNGRVSVERDRGSSGDSGVGCCHVGCGVCRGQLSSAEWIITSESSVITTETVSIVGPLGLGGNSQDQKASNL